MPPSEFHAPSSTPQRAAPPGTPAVWLLSACRKVFFGLRGLTTGTRCSVRLGMGMFRGRTQDMVRCPCSYLFLFGRSHVDRYSIMSAELTKLPDKSAKIVSFLTGHTCFSARQRETKAALMSRWMHKSDWVTPVVFIHCLILDVIVYAIVNMIT